MKWKHTSNYFKFLKLNQINPNIKAAGNSLLQKKIIIILESP